MQLALNIILNVFSVLSGFLALNRLYEKNFKMIWMKIGSLLLLTVGQAFISYLERPYLNSLTMIFLLIVMTKLLFQCRNYIFLLYDTFIAVCYFISDLIATLAISIATKNVVSITLQQSDLMLSRYLLNIILVFMLCNSISIIFQKKKNDAIYWYEVISYILLAVFEASSAAYISYFTQRFSSGMFLVFFLIGCFILDVYIVFVFYRLAESRRIEQEFLLIRQQSNIQLDVYRELSKKYEKSIRIVHDAKKHLNALKNLIESEKAATYRDSLCQELDKLYPEFHHSNQMLTVIINHALFKAEQSKIRFDLHIEEVDLLFISDNAIEACRTLTEDRRLIRLHVERKIGFIIIHITNPYEAINPDSEKMYKSTKYGHAGIGLSNVRKTVEKYNGVFDIETNERMFTVSITIPERI